MRVQAGAVAVPYTHCCAGAFTASMSWRTLFTRMRGTATVDVAACAPTVSTHVAKVWPLGNVMSMNASWFGGLACATFQFAVGVHVVGAGIAPPFGLSAVGYSQT